MGSVMERAVELEENTERLDLSTHEISIQRLKGDHPGGEGSRGRPFARIWAKVGGGQRSMASRANALPR